MGWLRYAVGTRSLWRRHAPDAVAPTSIAASSRWGAAGWHICFDVLDRLLSGTPIGRIVGAEAMKFGGWQRLNAEYAKQFGVEMPSAPDAEATQGGPWSPRRWLPQPPALSPLPAGCAGPAGSFPFWWSRSC